VHAPRPLPTGCGTSFEVRVVSAAFAGKRLLERHKLVNAALADLMPDIHALSIKKAKTPEEEAAAGAAVAAPAAATGAQ